MQSFPLKSNRQLVYTLLMMKLSFLMHELQNTPNHLESTAQIISKSRKPFRSVALICFCTTVVFYESTVLRHGWIISEWTALAGASWSPECATWAQQNLPPKVPGLRSFSFMLTIIYLSFSQRKKRCILWSREYSWNGNFMIEQQLGNYFLVFLFKLSHHLLKSFLVISN